MKEIQKGILYLVPKTIADNDFEFVIPSLILEITRNLKYFIVENERTTRRYLSKIKSNHPINEIQLFTLNKHTKYEDIEEFLSPIENGYDMGLMSEAGTPAVADPGSVIVALAHSRHYKVKPLVGPSSIILALMASGLNGQNFSFNGYLPIEKGNRINQLKIFERRSVSEKQTQIFIETPFRNDQLLADILSVCNENTQLCIAANICSEKEFIQTRSIAGWKKNRPLLNKQPAIFLLLG